MGRTRSKLLGLALQLSLYTLAADPISLRALLAGIGANLALSFALQAGTAALREPRDATGGGSE